MIHLMHGFIGAGKTTRARQLERELGALRLTPDEWMRPLFGEDPPAESFQARLQALLALLRGVWSRAASLGLPVILDYGFWSRAEREAIEADLRALGLEWRWEVLGTPLEECRRRNALRNAAPGRSLDISDATFDLLASRFEPMEGPERD